MKVEHTEKGSICSLFSPFSGKVIKKLLTSINEHIANIAQK